MTCRRMTPEEIKQADAAYRQWWLSVLTLGLSRNLNASRRQNMTDIEATTPGDPAMFAPPTADENSILHAHLASGWLKQAAVYPALSEPWQETHALLDGLHEAHRAARQAGREPEAGQ